MARSEIETVKRTAALARLDITDEEAERLGGQFARILAAFESLAQLDLEGVEGVVRASDSTGVLRTDEPRPSLSTDEVLRNAPAPVDGFYSVPKTIVSGGDS